MWYLVRRLIQDDGLEIASASGLEDAEGEVHHTHWLLTGEVESHAPERRVVRKLLYEGDVRGRGILDVDVVARERAIGANDRALPAQRGTNRPRHDAIEVEVAATIEVPASCYDHREPVGCRIGERDQVSAALGHVIGVSAAQRKVLLVREDIVAAVGLVAGCDHDLAHSRHAPTSLEEIPGSAYVRFERGDRVAVRDADDGLGGEMKDGLDLVFVQCALEAATILDLAADDCDPVLESGRVKPAVGNDVAHEAYLVRAQRDESLGKPAPEQSRASGDQDVAVAPQIRSGQRGSTVHVGITRFSTGHHRGPNRR